MKQRLCINQSRVGRWFLALLVMLMMPVTMWAYDYNYALEILGSGDTTPDVSGGEYIWGYVNGTETEANWGLNADCPLIYSTANGLLFTLSPTSGSLTITSPESNPFSGLLSRIVFGFEKVPATGVLSVSARVIETQKYTSTELSGSLQQDNTGQYAFILNEPIELTNMLIQISLNSPEQSLDIRDWNLLALQIDPVYDLWIGDTRVTGANASNILGDAGQTVSFAVTNSPTSVTPINTLTLNGAALTVPVIAGWDLSNLYIDIHGNNTITTYGTPITTVNEDTEVLLYIKSTDDPTGMLTIRNTIPDEYCGSVISYGYSEVSIEQPLEILLPCGPYPDSDLQFDSTHVARFGSSYGLSVGWVPVYDGNTNDLFGDGTASYDKSTNTLTLNNAKITGPIITPTDLIVNLIGSNSIYGHNGSAIRTTGQNATVTFVSSPQDKGGVRLKIDSYSNYPVVANNVTVTMNDYLEFISGEDYHAAGSSGGWNSLVEIGHLFDLSIAGEQVSTVNMTSIAEDQFEEGCISYDGDHTLTFNNIPNRVSNGQFPFIQCCTDMDIFLIGISEFDSGGSSFAAKIQGANGTPTLTFKTDEDAPGTLVIRGSGDFVDVNYTVQSPLLWKPEGYFDPTGENGPAFWVAVSYGEYGLAIDGVRVKNNNKHDIDGKGHLSFDPETNTLTVNGYTDGGDIWTDISQLIINIAQTSRVGRIYWSGQSETAGTLMFKREANAQAELTIDATITKTPSEESAISGFRTVGFASSDDDFAAGTNVEPAAKMGSYYDENSKRFVNGNKVVPKVIVTPTAWPVWVGDVQATLLTASEMIFPENSNYPTVSFNKPTNTLTLHDFQYEAASENDYGIVVQMSSLTIDVKGNNYINTVNAYRPAISFGSTTDNILTFKSSDNESVSLELYTYSYIPGITAEYVTCYYQDRLYKTDYNSDNGHYCYISTLEKPYFYTTEDDKGLPAFGFENAISTHYSIDYVNESLQDVTDAIYDPQTNGAVPMLGACVVTAWNQVGDVISETATGKLFGFAVDEMTIIEGQSLAMPEIVPAVGNDPVSFNYFSNNEQLVTISDGMLNGVSVGQTSVDANMQVGDTDYFILNPDGAVSPFAVNVISNSTGIWIYADKFPNNMRQITRLNPMVELGNDSFVFFDGHGRLTLKDAEIDRIEVRSGSVLNPEDGLEVMLLGENSMMNQGEGAILSLSAVAGLPLTFMANSSGKLVYTDQSNSPNMASIATAFQGFYPITYQNNLTGRFESLSELNVVTIATALATIVDGVGVPENVNLTNDPNAGAPLADVIVDGEILYTLDDNGTAGAPDGYTSQDGGMVVINSVMTDAAVLALAQSVYTNTPIVPGTPEFKALFKGVTFMVPAGIGSITVKAVTEEGHALHMMIGTQAPIEITTTEGDGQVINYSVTQDTYVYIYHVELENASATSAPQLAQRSPRIGPKTSVSTGLQGLNVTAGMVSEPPTASPYAMLDMAKVQRLGGGSHGILVSDAEATDIPDGAFAGPSSAPGFSPRTAAQNISFIDLSGTKITGKVYKHGEGAFAGVPASTLIYLPAGNYVADNDANFVIGGICDKLQLSTESETSFEVHDNFVAGNAQIDLPIGTNERATTVYLPFAIANPDEYGEFYEFNKMYADNGAVNMKPVEGGLEANKPYLFVAKQNGPLSLIQNSAQIAKPTTTVSDAFKGAYEKKSLANAYTFAPGTEVKGTFVQATGDVKPFTAYIDSNAGTPVVSLTWGGDVDRNNVITITDAVGVVNKILDQPSANFNVKAADLNGDYTISITDAVNVVNIILDSRNVAAPALDPVDDPASEVEPQ